MSEENVVIEKLPAVAKNVYVQCAKCEALRYHRVLAHTSKTAAKIECEVCGKKATYKISTGKTKSGRKVSSRRRTTRPTAEMIFNEWKEKVGIDDAAPYSMKTTFEEKTAIDHPKFGIGIIRQVTGQKIEVVFEDGERSLVHNRS